MDPELSVVAVTVPGMRENYASGGDFEDVYGYSRAVRVGDHIHVAGTCARALDGTDTYTQAKEALSIIETALKEAGSGPAAVVRTVTYVTDIGDKLQVARAHAEMFGDVRPAATLVEVRALVDPRMTVEIEAYAIAT
ncbi:Rid family hydrolase [Actinophytocola algeriensis]|uniref:Enamine deaminase RidA (YjgF/YER057c/UK114 family) n=1 Tax=Actinophytocola algeriensis TaxID=1768010 RepID=A0A7W7Q0D8_9PSEU|nr:Rid family hydrolase [Actinophytocola algeriensis]MBB4904533.1 enamine deaminase RidA (YjgF/YER057c/UK114 family) [Actinophytocola algeriensis]MBE1476608.1 enamine deaminase RidA (YjgF/YER057c/UK114 family) [Actinophytocola algeriensis]